MWRGKRQSPRSGIINSGIIMSIKDMSLIKLRKIMKDREAWWAAVHGVTVRYSWATEQQQRKREMFSLTGKGNRAQWRESHSIMSNSLRPHGLYSPWNSPGQNTGVGSFLFQGIFPTQGLNPGLPHCRWILYQLSHRGRPQVLEWVAYLFSSGSSQPRSQTGVSCIAGRFFTNWAIREVLIGPREKREVAQSCLTLCNPMD